MKATNRKRRAGIYITPEERKQYIQETENENPGYINENEKLTSLVWSMAGIRVMYGAFYAFMAYMYGMPISQGIAIMASSIFFFLWYSWMLRSGKLIAVLMLVFRGVGIAMGGASLIPMAPWLPITLIFTLTFSIFMEFAEAVFCIYVLFNSQAANTVTLNRALDEGFINRHASRKMLVELSEYRNDSQTQEDELTDNSESQETKKKNANEEEQEQQNT